MTDFIPIEFEISQTNPDVIPYLPALKAGPAIMRSGFNSFICSRILFSNSVIFSDAQLSPAVIVYSILKESPNKLFRGIPGPTGPSMMSKGLIAIGE